MVLKTIIIPIYILFQGIGTVAQVPWIESTYRDIKFPSEEYYVSYYHLINDNHNLDECVAKTVVGAQSMLANSIFSEVSSVSISTMSAVNQDGNYNENESFFNEFTAAASAKLVNIAIEHYYDKTTNTAHAIAYVKKQDLSTFCEQKISAILASLNSKFEAIDNLATCGYKNEARKLIDEAIKELESCPPYISQLIAIGLTKSDTSGMVRDFENKKSRVLKNKSDMEHATTIYISATHYSPFVRTENLASKCRGILANNGCSFVDNVDDADFIVDISYQTRTSSSTDAGCFAFSDITLTITRKRDASVIYDDMISVKGGAGTEEKAHRKAIDLSSKPICEKIMNCIQ